TLNDTTTAVDDRTFRGQQDLHRLLNLTGVSLSRNRVGAQLDRLRVTVRKFLSRIGDILGNVDHDRTGSAGGGNVECLLDHHWDVLRILHHEAVLHDG